MLFAISGSVEQATFKETGMVQGKPEFSGLVVITSGSKRAWAQINILRDAIGPFPVMLVSQDDLSEVPDRGLIGNLIRKSRGGAFSSNEVSSKKRIETLVETHGFRTSADLDQYISHLVRADTLRFQDVIRKIGPKLVLVIDASTLSRETLGATDARFVRVHLAKEPKQTPVHLGGRSGNLGVCAYELDYDLSAGEVLFSTVPELEKRDTLAVGVLAGDRSLTGRLGDAGEGASVRSRRRRSRKCGAERKCRTVIGAPY